MLKKYYAVLAIALAVAQNSVVFAQDNKGENMKEDILIPREVLFGNPDKIAVRMSENGEYISYIAPLDGVLNIFIAPTSNPLDARAITDDRERGIRNYSWAKNNSNIIYAIDNKGDENFRLHSIDIKTLENKLLTPQNGVRSGIVKISKNFPDEILVRMNKLVPEYFDIYKINVKTGETELIFENKEKYTDFTIDDDLKIRLAYKMLPTGEGEIYFFKDGNVSESELFQKIKVEDMLTTSALHINSKKKDDL